MTQFKAEDGDVVASELEAIVDNALYKEGLTHKVHPSVPGSKKFEADFIVGDVFVEVWGVQNNEDYETEKEEKLNFYSLKGLAKRLVEIEAKDCEKATTIAKKIQEIKDKQKQKQEKLSSNKEGKAISQRTIGHEGIAEIISKSKGELKEIDAEIQKLKNEKNEFETTFKASNKWIFFLILPVAIGLTLFSKDILGIMFGHEYAQSYIALIILIMGYFIYEMFVTCIEVLNVIKKTKYVMFNMLLAAILNIILNYILIPTYGMVGGAIATAGSMIIYGLLSVIEAFYFTRIWPLKMKYFKAIITGILTLIITWKIMTLIPFRNVYSLAIGLITIMISYFPLLLIFKSLEKEDIEILKAIEARSGFRFNFIRNVVKRFI